MKVIAIIILTFLSFNTSPFAQETVSCETDEFTGNTNCKSGFVQISTDEAQVSKAILSFLYYPPKSSHWPKYVILFSFSGKAWSSLDKDWSYLDTDTVYFLIDGERKSFDFQKVNSDNLDADIGYFLINGERESFDFQKVNSDISPGYVIEHYAVQVHPKDFEFLTNSSEIRFKLRSDIYEFNEEAMNTIKDLKETVFEYVLKNIVNEKNNQK